MLCLLVSHCHQLQMLISRVACSTCVDVCSWGNCCFTNKGGRTQKLLLSSTSGQKRHLVSLKLFFHSWYFFLTRGTMYNNYFDSKSTPFVNPVFMLLCQYFYLCSNSYLWQIMFFWFVITISWIGCVLSNIVFTVWQLLPVKNSKENSCLQPSFWKCF